MKVRWTPEAESDRLLIFEYIAADSPRSAIKMDEVFGKAAARLADHPGFGRAGRIPGTREVIAHKSYCLVYEIEQDTAWILALAHTARQWPPVAR
ncbi:MAG: type II toxin-antitoxin system RelE/ParE family toxin [Rhodocyclaceae bacterium]|nr:type II toxin-antitoxin system RelE/ParE family toxin [Rhodocyclaceae bacterium]MDZ4214771.1 type II toxin-antitoxin system RelE/ParE family toxin [Rhodocyclaceae bacterium]